MNVFSKRSITLVAGIGLVSLLAAGCGTTTAASVIGKRGGTVVMALPVDTSPNWFFPVFSAADFTSTNEEVDALLYKPLFDITDHNTVDYSHSLVNKVTVTDGGRIYTLHMNPRYHWSNGHPVSARDVVFTWNIMKAASSDAAHLAFTYGGAGTGGVPNDVQSVKALNTSTVEVTLTKGVNSDWFIRNGLGQINPVSASVFNRYPHSLSRELSYINSIANSPTNPAYAVVDGPYHFSNYTANNDWVFRPNTHYSGRRSSISKLVFQYETSSSSEFAALKTGGLTVGYVPMSLWSSRHALTGYHVTAGYPWGLTYLQLNFNSNAEHHINHLFNHLYVRQALAMGLNQPQIIKILYHGQGVEANGPVPKKPSTPFYDTALNSLTYPYNPKAGESLLERHGWHLDHGIMTKNGAPLAFSIDYETGSPTSTNLMQYLASSWAKEGIRVTLDPTPASAFPLPNQKWEAIFTGLTSWVYSPDFYPTGGGLFKTGSALNFWGYSNREMDDLIDLTYDPDSTARQEQQRIDAYQQYASRNLPLLFLPYAASFYVSADSLHGYRHSLNLISGLISPNEWTLTH